jgi:hypothetical protein
LEISSFVVYIDCSSDIIFIRLCASRSLKMDHRGASNNLMNRIERASTKLSIQRTEYNNYLEVSQTIAFNLLLKVQTSEHEMAEMKTNLFELERKTKAHTNILDRHLYSRRLKHIFTRCTWMERDIHYSKMLHTNNTEIAIFNSSVNLDNIDDIERQQYFGELIRIRTVFTEQKNKQKAFFNWD